MDTVPVNCYDHTCGISSTEGQTAHSGHRQPGGPAGGMEITAKAAYPSIDEYMFQKLYRHLEEINISLREKKGEGAANALVQEKMLEQLRQLNDSIRAREGHYLSAQRAIARYAGILCGLIIFCVTAFIFVEIRLQRAERPATARTSTCQNARPVIAGPAAEDAHYRENVQKLDSLVTEQALSIKELTKLNRIAVYSLRRIRKHYEALDKKSLASSNEQAP